jgi:hypothetical protein
MQSGIEAKNLFFIDTLRPIGTKEGRPQKPPFFSDPGNQKPEIAKVVFTKMVFAKRKPLPSVLRPLSSVFCLGTNRYLLAYYKAWRFAAILNAVACKESGGSIN